MTTKTTDGASSKKSTSGTKPTARRASKKDLSDLPSDKIIDIINICKSTNVRNFKYGPLEIAFSDSDSGCACTGKVVAAAPAPKAEIYVSKEDEEQARLAQLMIDDPQAFEQEVIDSHTSGWSQHA